MDGVQHLLDCLTAVMRYNNVDFLVVCVGKGKREAFIGALREFKRDIVIESNPKETD